MARVHCPLRFGWHLTTAAGWLARPYGPIVGGLFLAFPPIFPASATLLDKHEREKKRQAGYTSTIRGRLAAALDARGAVMGAMGGIVFALLTWNLQPWVAGSQWPACFGMYVGTLHGRVEEDFASNTLLRES